VGIIIGQQIKKYIIEHKNKRIEVYKPIGIDIREIDKLILGNIETQKQISFVVVSRQEQIEQPTETSRSVITREYREYKLDDDKELIRNFAHDLCVENWGEDEWIYFDDLIMRESSYDPNVKNGTSGACGIAQAYPCSKVDDDYRNNWKNQIYWMVDYIKNKYEKPSNAIEYHNKFNSY